MKLKANSVAVEFIRCHIVIRRWSPEVVAARMREKGKEGEIPGVSNKTLWEKRKNKKPRGKEPKPPAETPPDHKQYNFTDPESRIMKAGNGDHFEQAYNAQAAVDTETYPIVGQLVTDAPNDKQQLNPVLESIPAEVAEPENILADTGYYSEDAVQKAEADDGPTVYCAMAKSGHHVSVTDLEKHPPAFPPSLDAPIGTGGPPPQYARGQGALQAAQTYRRTRFWDH